MQPGCDVGFIRRPGGVPIARALGVGPRPVETIDSLDLFARAVALSEAGMAHLPDRVAEAAVRDAALLGLLALFAPRVGELAALRLGEHLVEENGTFRLMLPGSITKTKRGRGFALSEPLAALIRRYLDHVRPGWEPAGGTPELWLGGRQRALTSKVIQEIVGKRTRAWTGQRRRATWFRKCLTTTSAMRGPDFAFDTALVMGHGPGVALRHYAMATAVAAADRHQERQRRRRAETRAAAMRFYRGRRRGSQRLGGLGEDQ
jgi:integrase